jgi:predicted RNA-binding protein with PUA-like domain
MNYWIFKSEPQAFSIQNLEESPNRTTTWDGIRNYQVRNFIRDEMRKKDKVLFYHSSCKEIGIVGVCEITKEAYPDHTSFDPKEKYYDPKSDPENPRWFMVDVKLKKIFKRIISLQELKTYPELKNLRLIQKGNRLSISSLTKEEFDFILSIV